MSLELDDLLRDLDRILLMLQQMAEVTEGEHSRIISLEIECDTVLAERDAARAERDLVREERDAAQAEIEKLRLLIRQLQRGQFGRRSERLDPDQAAAAGIELDRSTLCDWVGRACWWLEPLWRLLRRHVMSSTRIFADDTRLPVLDPG
jgi:hypothetical protein